MSDELKWPEPDSYAVMAFGTHQKLVVRADVAEEWASKYHEQGFINVSVVPLFTYAQTCELVASLRSELEAARGKVWNAPPGWKLVPVEPTPEMGWAYLDAARLHSASSADDTMRFSWGGYRAMLKAAPQP